MKPQIVFILKTTLANGNTIYQVYNYKDTALTRLQFVQKNYPLDKVELLEATLGE